MEELITIPEAIEELGKNVTAGMIRNWCSKGLNHIRGVNNSILLKRSDINRYINMTEAERRDLANKIK